MAQPVSTVITAQPDGMNAALHPALIPETSYARGINVSVRGGYVGTRPGFHMISSSVATDISEGYDFFQGASTWRTIDGAFVVTVFSGVVRITRVDTGDTIVVGPFLPPSGTIHIIQAGTFLVFHGGSATSFLAMDWVDHAYMIVKTPLIPTSMVDDAWDARMQSVSFSNAVADLIAARDKERADIIADNQASGGTTPLPAALTYAEALETVYEAFIEDTGTPAYPPGTVCCFAHGRIHLSSTELNHRYFLSSDIMLPSNPKSVLMWWEDSYLNSGGGFGLPDEMGEIRAMSVLQNSSDTASGVGPMIVLAQDGAAAFSVNKPREGVFDMSAADKDGAVALSAKMIEPGWKDAQFSQVLFYGGGTESPWGAVRVNGDLLYRSLDGIRTVKATGAASAASVVTNAPISSEVQPFIDFDSGALELDRVSAVSADNRVLITAGRKENYYQGIIALDMNVMSSMRQQQGQIAYDGLWTGINVAKVLSVDGILLIVANDGRIYKVVKDRWDVVDGKRRDIECQWITKKTDFRAPTLRKTLDYVDLWVRDLHGRVDIEVYYRPDNYEWWTRMSDVVSINAPKDLPRQERRRLRFKPNFTHITSYDGTIITKGDTFQFLVRWRGEAIIHRLTVLGSAEMESPPISVDHCDFSNIEIEPTTQILQDDFSYQG